MCPYNLHTDRLALLWLAVGVIVSIQSSHWLTCTAVVGSWSDCVHTIFTLTDLHCCGWQLEWLCPYNLHIDWLALLWLAVGVIVSIQSSHWLTCTAVVGSWSDCVHTIFTLTDLHCCGWQYNLHTDLGCYDWQDCGHTIFTLTDLHCCGWQYNLHTDLGCYDWQDCGHTIFTLTDLGCYGWLLVIVQSSHRLT